MTAGTKEQKTLPITLRGTSELQTAGSHCFVYGSSITPFLFFSPSPLCLIKVLAHVKVERLKSAPAEAPLSHRKRCSWNVSSAAPPLIWGLCDITLRHYVFASFGTHWAMCELINQSKLGIMKISTICLPLSVYKHRSWIWSQNVNIQYTCVQEFIRSRQPNQTLTLNPEACTWLIDRSAKRPNWIPPKGEFCRCAVKLPTCYASRANKPITAKHFIRKAVNGDWNGCKLTNSARRAWSTNREKIHRQKERLTCASSARAPCAASSAEGRGSRCRWGRRAEVPSEGSFLSPVGRPKTCRWVRCAFINSLWCGNKP